MNKRFKPGAIYPFIRFKNKTENGNEFFSVMSFDIESGMPHEIINLKCKSEHEVPIDYTNDKELGYVFEADDGREFNNQYPSASYSQTSTITDAIVQRYHEKDGKPELDDYIFIGHVINSLSSFLYKSKEHIHYDVVQQFQQMLIEQVNEAGLEMIESNLSKKANIYKFYNFRAKE